MDEINIVLVNLPASVKGCVLPEADGSYTVYINAIYNQEQRKDIFEHEMRHLLYGHHLQQDRNINELELEASEENSMLGAIQRAMLRGLPQPSQFNAFAHHKALLHPPSLAPAAHKVAQTCSPLQALRPPNIEPPQTLPRQTTAEQKASSCPACLPENNTLLYWRRGRLCGHWY